MLASWLYLTLNGSLKVWALCTLSIAALGKLWQCHIWEGFVRLWYLLITTCDLRNGWNLVEISWTQGTIGGRVGSQERRVEIQVSQQHRGVKSQKLGPFSTPPKFQLMKFHMFHIPNILIFLIPYSRRHINHLHACFHRAVTKLLLHAFLVALSADPQQNCCLL